MNFNTSPDVFSGNYYRAASNFGMRWTDEEGEDIVTLIAETSLYTADREVIVPNNDGYLVVSSRDDGNIHWEDVLSNSNISGSNNYLMSSATEARFRDAGNRIYSPSTSRFVIESTTGYNIEIDAQGNDLIFRTDNSSDFKFDDTSAAGDGLFNFGG